MELDLIAKETQGIDATDLKKKKLAILSYQVYMDARYRLVLQHVFTTLQHVSDSKYFCQGILYFVVKG